MTRKELLDKGYTEEQATEILNLTHATSEALEKAKTELNEIKNQNATIVTENTEMKTQLEELAKSKMTEQELLVEKQKEIERNLIQSRITLNKAEIKTELSGLGIANEELETILNAIVTESKDDSLKNAKALRSSIEALKENVEKETKKNLINVNVKPDTTDSVPTETMTPEKFKAMSYDEMKAFKETNPEEFKVLMNS